MIFDYILSCSLAIIVNVLVTKPFSNLLDLLMKKPKKSELIVDTNNNLEFNGKMSLDKTKTGDILVLTNAAFDDNQLNDKQVITDTYIQNIDTNSNDIKEKENKWIALKM